MGPGRVRLHRATRRMTRSIDHVVLELPELPPEPELSVPLPSVLPPEPLLPELLLPSVLPPELLSPESTPLMGGTQNPRGEHTLSSQHEPSSEHHWASSICGMQPT